MTNTRLNNEDAAEYLGYTPKTFRKSRHTGMLAGITGPKYIMLGRRAWYDKADLDAWLAQFPKVGNTAEADFLAPKLGDPVPPSTTKKR